MEIAHAQTGILRVVAKIILLGLLVVLLAKVIVALVALAIVGLLCFLCARTLYSRRNSMKRILFWVEEKILASAIAVLHAIVTVIVTAAGWLFLAASWIFLRLSRCTLRNSKQCLYYLCRVALQMITLIRLALVPIAYLAGVGWAAGWNLARHFQKIVFCPLLATGRSAGAAVVMVRKHSRVICGTLLEAASGALVGTMIGIIFHPHPFGAMVCIAALFGAFLGVTVGLSRITPAESELPYAQENEN
jgi:hypothetical protein